MFDFVTHLWPVAQRAPASIPPTDPSEPALDDHWKLAGKPPATKRKASGKRAAKVRRPSPPVDGVDAVILALIAACRESGPWRMLSVTELAEAMACSVGEASKRVKEATADERFAWAQRSGRRKMIGLHRVSSAQWQEIVASAPPAAVGLYRLAVRRDNRAAAPEVVHRPT